MCDQDDIWLPEKLSRLAGVLDDNPQTGAVFSNARIIDSQSKPTGTFLSNANGFTDSEVARLREGKVFTGPTLNDQGVWVYADGPRELAAKDTTRSA